MHVSELFLLLGRVLHFDGLNFAVVVFAFYRNERYLRAFPAQLGARLKLAGLKWNVLGNVYASVISGMQSERAVSCGKFQPYFNPRTCYIADFAFGIYRAVVRSNLENCALREAQRQKRENASHGQREPGHNV
jgi:hypothetical protein